MRDLLVKADGGDETLHFVIDSLFLAADQFVEIGRSSSALPSEF